MYIIPETLRVDSPSIGEGMGKIEFSADLREYIFILDTYCEVISLEELEELVKKIKSLNKEYT